MTNTRDLKTNSVRGRLAAGLLLLLLLVSPGFGAGLFERRDLEQVCAGRPVPAAETALRATIWRDLIDAYGVSRDGMIVEAGVGGSDDIGLGLALFGFRGRLWVVEPDPVVLDAAIARYRALLPSVEVVPVEAPIAEGVSRVPGSPDLFLSNHALAAVATVGSDARNIWTHLIGKLDPRLVIISQDPEKISPTAEARSRHDAALRLLAELRPAGAMPRPIEQLLQAGGYDPAKWLIECRYGIDGAALGNVIPSAVTRLGTSTFVVMDAYPVDPKRAKTLFVHEDLQQLMLGTAAGGDRPTGFVERNLLLSLDPKDAASGATPLRVYVDRQADPMNMSLTGNLGSGRAAYVGDRFNLKGIGKTVLATSKDPLHSNGVVDMVSALWEMICANALQTNIRTGTSPVLSVIDNDKRVHVEWVDQKVPGGIIVRLTDHGELDRPTHLFHRNQPVKAEQLRYMARRYGMQDAEKFIERILHGGWSAGNISIDGHLIDYETVFAVRGRAPQWSYRPNWLSDFFGLEGLGQKELLTALAKHSINVEGVAPTELHRLFDKARKSWLERRFPDLLGVNPREFLPRRLEFYRTVSSLVRQFERLSMKMYPHFAATSPWDQDNAGLSVYDLSRFFRYYPILRRTGKVDEKTALRLLKNPLGKNVWSVETEEYGMPGDIEAALLKDFVVSSPGQVEKLDREALAFIREFDGFLTALWEAFPESIEAMCRRAYVVNEERTYMNSRPGNDTLIALVEWYGDGRLKPEGFSEILHLILEACDRIPRYDARQRCQTDMKLYQNAYVSNLVQPDGVSYQPRLTLLGAPLVSGEGAAVLNELADRQGTQHSLWSVEIEGTRHPCTIEREKNRVHIIGPVLPLARLINEAGAPLFSRDGTSFPLKPIVRKRQEPVYYR